MCLRNVSSVFVDRPALTEMCLRNVSSSAGGTVVTAVRTQYIYICTTGTLACKPQRPQYRNSQETWCTLNRSIATLGHDRLDGSCAIRRGEWHVPILPRRHVSHVLPKSDMPKFGWSDKKMAGRDFAAKSVASYPWRQNKTKMSLEEDEDVSWDVWQTWISIQTQRSPGAVATISVKKTLQTSRLL